MNVLFSFVRRFLQLLLSSLFLGQLNEFVELLPQNITLAKKLIGNTCDSFSKYASCSKCHSIYPPDACKIALLKMGSRSDNLCVNVATKYTSYIYIHGATVANLCC